MPSSQLAPHPTSVGRPWEREECHEKEDDQDEEEEEEEDRRRTHHEQEEVHEVQVLGEEMGGEALEGRAVAASLVRSRRTHGET